MHIRIRVLFCIFGQILLLFMKQSIGAAFIAAAIVIAAGIFAFAYSNRHKSGDVIYVTGLGSKDFTSDLIVWEGTFARRSFDLKSASAALNKDRETVKNYLISKGVPESSMVFSAVNIQKEYENHYDHNGNYTSTFSGYSLSQVVSIESGEVDKIENIVREVTELINEGVELYSPSPEYYYTKLAELKIEMIAAATQDARVRAEQIATNSNASLGHLRNATMGIFQITGQNSSEDYSWGGTFNTIAKKKTASITMRLEFQVD